MKFLSSDLSIDGKGLRRKLSVIAGLMSALPFFVFLYILFKEGVLFSFTYAYAVMLFLTLALASAGLFILRRVFDEFLLMTAFMKKADAGDMYLMEAHNHTAELHDMAVSFNRLLGKLEETSMRLEEQAQELKREISGRRQAEDRLILLRDALECLPLGITICDPAGKVVYTNTAEAGIHGYSVADLLGRDARMFAPPELWRPRSFEEMQTLGVWKRESRNIRKNGEIFPVRLTSVAAKDANGAPIGIITACEDITENKRIEEELRKYSEKLEERVAERTRELQQAQIISEAASRAKTEFISNMSHELKTPLNSIIGFSTVILEGMAGNVNDDQKEYLGYVVESGKTLLDSVTRILELSEVDAGDMKLDLSRFSLRQLLEQSIRLFREKALKHSLTLSAHIPEEIDLVTADQGKIKHVLANLLSNALKFTPDGGSVTVRARKFLSSPPMGKGNGGGIPFVEISVADTGIGMSEQDLSRLFQPFEQLEPPLTKKYTGMGSGLYLCKSLVEIHGGRIWAESGPGKGSRFLFSIPVTPPPNSI